MKTPQYIFRVDASFQIGTGHVMRCLTLATSLRKRGANCRFICRELDGNMVDLIQNQGFETNCLPSPIECPTISAQPNSPSLPHSGWLGVEQNLDAEQSINCLKNNGRIEWMIVDHYALDYRWESLIRPFCERIMVIDDLADRVHDCDLLLDQNLMENPNHRYNDKYPEHCDLLLGPQFALLQSQYAILRDRIPPREGNVERILVYFGGADTDNLTGRAISAFLALNRPDIQLDVVMTSSSPHLHDVRNKIADHTNIYLHQGLPSLAPLLVSCDLAIGASGATSWERCCLGLPAIVITLAENQKPIAKALDDQGYIRWLGHKEQVSSEKLSKVLHEVLENENINIWSDHCLNLVDGLGAQRVSNILMLSNQVSMSARHARPDDSTLIWQWINNPGNKNSGFLSQFVSDEAFHSWFRRSLRDLKKIHHFVMETVEGYPVGIVCFAKKGGTWIADRAINDCLLNQGLSKQILLEGVKFLRKNTNDSLRFNPFVESDHLASSFVSASGSGKKNKTLTISVCTDAGSWINQFIPDLILTWLAEGHQVQWVHSSKDLNQGDICFYLSYSRIVNEQTLGLSKNNLVVHESDLPKGRGWSPMSWAILHGETRIPVTLFEALNEVDSGSVYLQEWIELTGKELSEQWRKYQGSATQRLCLRFVREYPAILNSARPQSGEPSYYPRRRPEDSELNPSETLLNQFNLLRIVDNNSYPAFFDHKGKKYLLKIESMND